MTPDPLDIPEFLRRQPGDDGKPPCALPDTVKAKPERRRKRPANWYMLTKAEQDGTADATTIALRKQLERDKKDKQAERFARLKELAEERKRTKCR
jgi:hypothetical protein